MKSAKITAVVTAFIMIFSSFALLGAAQQIPGYYDDEEDTTKSSSASTIAGGITDLIGLASDALSQFGITSGDDVFSVIGKVIDEFNNYRNDTNPTTEPEEEEGTTEAPATEAPVTTPPTTAQAVTQQEVPSYSVPSNSSNSSSGGYSQSVTAVPTTEPETETELVIPETITTEELTTPLTAPEIYTDIIEAPDDGIGIKGGIGIFLLVIMLPAAIAGIVFMKKAKI